MTIYGRSEELVSRCVECDLAEPESLTSLGGSAPGVVDGILSDTQCDVCLYIDIMYSNGMPFLTTISKNIKYCTAMWVADCTAPTIASLVESILKIYQWAGFQVTEVCANHKFNPVLQVLQDSGWSFMTNFANAQEHVPEAEHNNHVLKEHIHTTYHGIPYKMIP